MWKKIKTKNENFNTYLDFNDELKTVEGDVSVE